MPSPNYYSFSSFVRKGIANGIRNAADLSAGASGNSTVKARPSVEATIYLNFDGQNTAGSQVKKTLDVYSPANVVGIDKRAIIRTDPPHYCTNFEPNYLACIEFFEEDFPWRYTPSSINSADAQNQKLTPWLALVVLQEEEFEAVNVSADLTDVKQLPYFKLTSSAVPDQLFAPFQELHHWAHVHVNADISSNPTASLNQQMDEDGDRCYSRLICPRRLRANSGYHAFLIPAFETGRLAGLGNFEAAEDTSVNQSSWDSGQTDFPYYHRWYFATGAMGDFEYLARQLKPKPANEKIGYRPLVVDGIAQPLQLPGCLRVPLNTLPPAKKTAIENYEKWAGKTPHPWQLDTAANIDVLTGNLADPVINRPLYGRWHARVEAKLYNGAGAAATLNPANKQWIADLNLDPRYRAIAALGVAAVQKNQEKFMDAAWDQVEEIRAANEKIRLAQLSIQINKSFQQGVLKRFTDEQLIVFTVPIHQKVSAQIGPGLTVHKALKDSAVPDSVSKNVFRKVSRNTGRLAQLGQNKAQWFSDRVHLLDQLNKNQVACMQDKLLPTGLITQVKFTAALNNYIAKQPFYTGASPQDRTKILQSAGNAFLGNPVFIEYFNKPTTVFNYRAITPVFGKAGPKVVLPQPVSAVTPLRSSVPPGKDIFGSAVKNNSTAVSLQQEVKPIPTVPVNIAQAKSTILVKIAPTPLFSHWYSTLFPQLFDPKVVIPEWFPPVMKYPVFELPTYLLLKEKSTEYFLPNLNLIEPNSVTLLETNQKFIEAYLAGLNYEMARELLWRGYPTDQKGSYFRLFWDSISERYDINEMHRWNQPLGFNNAERTDNYLVLVVRGDLLKKFPRTVIGVQKARWGASLQDDRLIDDTAPFILPIFESYLEPDLFFLGFNLREEELIGQKNATSTTQNPGSFFILKERPGEPRFGLDESSGKTSLTRWSDLSWAQVHTAKNEVLKMSSTPQSITFSKTGDDVQASFPAANSAQLAYILYQQPALIAIHASQLLSQK